MHIGLTYDLRDEYLAAGYSQKGTADFDQSDTIQAIDHALQTLGHTTDRIGHARGLVERLGQGDRWDLVFNTCEGLHGAAREAQVPAILDVYEVPYTLSDSRVLSVCQDKALAKTVARAAGIPTPEWFVVRKISDIASCRIPFPLIAKPLFESRGRGIDGASKVMDPTALRQLCERLLKQYQQPVLVEQFMSGREFAVGVLGSGTDAEVIGTLEIRLQPHAEADVYSYVNKAQSEEMCEFALVRRTDKRVAEAEQAALAAWRAVGGRDCGLIDLRCDGLGHPKLIEINPLSGLNPTRSLLPMIWSAGDRDYSDFIARIVESALARVSYAPMTTASTVARL